MPHFAKPFYRKRRKRWYVEVNGKQINLGSDREAAFTKYHDLMSGETPHPCDPGLLDKFLTWTKENRSEKTWRGYKDFLDSFRAKHPSLTTNVLRPFHILEWLSEQTAWNSSTKRGAITAVQRALNWGVKMGYIDRNPVKGMEKPEAKTRTTVITLPEFKQILRNTPDKEFRQLLTFCWDCGCRPVEAKRLCGRHVQIDKRRCVFPASEAKGKKRVRVIYLATERSVRIIKRLMHLDGPIFRDTQGRPWTASAVRDRFEHLTSKVGKRFRQTDTRHTWITRKLIAGVDSHVVGKLAGHADTSMIDRVYSHVADDHDFMLAQSMRGITASPASAAGQ